jgi:ubiquinone/menaquinone biosynthesis C-methylase UbiE
MYDDQDTIIGAFFDDCARKGFMASFGPDDMNTLDVFFKEWNIAPGDRIFEPGCGSGRLTELLALRAGPEGAVVACDLSGVMIDLARARNLPETVTLSRGSVADIRVRDCFFDKVLLFQVFPHFTNRSLALETIRRFLRDDGDLWINHLRSREEINALHQSSSAVVISHHIPEDDELHELLDSSGFDVDFIRNAPDGFSAHARKR